MVNIGTVQNGLSHRITEIDPRGCAAVTGPNGVGKTTTLRLFPLFYGARPSGLIDRNGGQESIIKFVLPSARSALVFEYSRGPGEHDLRMVVIRSRGEGSDAAEYRLFKSGYRRELFVDDDGTILDDGQSCDRATELGIEPPSRKLTSTEYRNVILGLQAQTQSERDLRRLSIDYALCRSAMPNLDRLVAAVVKPNVNFGDLVQVVVGMVMDKVGAPASERGRVTMRQTTGQIKRWVADRRACEEARIQRPVALEMKASLSTLAQARIELRALSAEAQFLVAQREQSQADLQAENEKLASDRKEEIEAEEQQAKSLSESYAETEEAFKAKGRVAGAASDEQAEFKRGDAPGWKAKMPDLPSLRLERSNVADQITLLEDRAGSILSEVNAMRKGIEDRINAELESRPELEKPIRDRYEADMTRLAGEERSQEDLVREQHTAAREVLEAEITEIDLKLGAAQRDCEKPQVEQALVDARESAQTHVNEVRKAHGPLVDAASKAEAMVGQVDAKYQDAERALRDAHRAHKLAAADTQRARAILVPEDGTLLASLKAAPAEQWKPDLAKVINPALLMRTDMSPHVSAAGSTDVLGWTLDTSEIELPSWADDDAQRSEVKRLEGLENEAAEVISACTSALASADDERKNSQKARDLAFGLRKINEQRLVAAQSKLDEATDALAAAKRDALRLANEAKALIEAKAKELKGQRRSLASRHNQERERLRQDYVLRSTQIKEESDKELAELAKGLAARIGALREQINELKLLEQKRMSEAGVDTDAVGKLRSRSRELEVLIYSIESNTTMVHRYESYLSRGGDDWVVSLNRELAVARQDHNEVEKQIRAFNTRRQESESKYRRQSHLLADQANEITRQLRKVEMLRDELSDHPPSQGHSFEASTTSENLAARVDETQARIRSASKVAESQYSKLKNALTARDSNVRELVIRASEIVTDESLESRCLALESAYEEVERTIVPLVTEELGTMLTAAAEFRRRIDDFESEVERINTRLVKGLAQVDSFPRLKDLELRVTTDFADLDIVRKARTLDSLRGSLRLRATQDNWLPDQAVELALTDFMSAIDDGGRTEVSLSSHVTLRGQVTENGKVKAFKTAEELKNISSTGLSSLVLITLLVGLLNMIRKDSDVYFAWTTDEVGTFDGGNFTALLEMLRSNKIDVITASPELSMAQYRKFAHRYQMADGGRILTYTGPAAARNLEVTA